ncbi:MAG: YcfL family protein [Gammaproteobacteria bacterium]
MKTRALLALVVTGALIAGCGQFKTTKTADGDKVKYQVVTSGNTDDRIEVINVVAGKAGDLVKASVEMKNKSRFAYTFEYRFKWYDGSGMEISPDSTAWIPLSMMGNETKSLQALAPNPTAETFKLFLQEKP